MSRVNYTKQIIFFNLIRFCQENKRVANAILMIDDVWFGKTERVMDADRKAKGNNIEEG